jgi:hypothetical protein
MDKYDDISTDENILILNVPDDVLERAAAAPDGPAWTLNYCTYNYYQCGPIGWVGLVVVGLLNVRFGS